MADKSLDKELELVLNLPLWVKSTSGSSVGESLLDDDLSVIYDIDDY